MNTIGQLFKKAIDRVIEEVVKVDQTNESTVRNEIEEYVATDAIREQFRMVYDEIVTGPAAPREGVGIWVSGFFGSGKSSFSKILGYTVANRNLGKETASTLFKRTVADQRVNNLLDLINSKIQFHPVIFDVSMDRGVQPESDRLTKIMYRALLRELGYAEDFDLAEMEIALEGDGRLERFELEFKNVHGAEWRKRRQLGLAINEANAVLNVLDAKTYPTADSYALGIGKGRTRADIDPNKLARRAFELCERREKGKALFFVIDEVGQYVSRSIDKMLDLQAIIQAFGVEGKNRTERRQAVSPFWIVVTSQEKLTEVVTAFDDRKKIELARLQDRFRIAVDLKQSDIRQVVSERVLKKTTKAEKELAQLFDDNAPRLKDCCTLERSSRNIEISRSALVDLYPYLPYHIELCIDIVAGLRLKRGTSRHIGGSNRTIIKQAQEMMINNRTRLADAPVGALVTLDKVYELLEAGNLLPTEVTREIASVRERLPDDLWAVRVAKATTLLETVKDCPRTPHNIAVVLHPALDADPVRKDVQKALDALENAQFVRQTEEGYKLLTVQEKNWETTRNEKDPRQADRNRIVKEVVAEIFSEPKVRSFRYKDLRNFGMAVSVNGEAAAEDGEIPLGLMIGSTDERSAALQNARIESSSRQRDIFLVVSVDSDATNLICDQYRSNEMINEYDRLSAQQKLTAEESTCLSEEKSRRDRAARNLRQKMLKCIENGTFFFDGTAREASTLGANLPEALGKMVETVVPAIYPGLETGILRLKGEEIDKFLTSANLNGLPGIFYNDKAEKSLVVKQGDRFVPNLGCDLCRELLEYLKREQSYGNRVTGKMIETRFRGNGYGWEMESIRLGIAILFRGGAVEATHQGRKYRNFTEPASRSPFVKNPDFRNASFSPREALDLRVLANAARAYEELSGREVDIEENALAQAFKQVAAGDREKAAPLAARFSALDLPGANLVKEYLSTVEGMLEMPADDCVRTLAAEGKTYGENRKRIRDLEKAATDANAECLVRTKRILREQLPVLISRGIADNEMIDSARGAENLLQTDDALLQIDRLRQGTEPVEQAYRNLYQRSFEQRKALYAQALSAIMGTPEWLTVSSTSAVDQPTRDSLLQPLRSRAEAEMDLPPGATVCSRTGASLGQLESDLSAVEAISRNAMDRILKLAAPEERIERVSIRNLYPSRITTIDELDAFLNDLRERLTKVLSQKASVLLE